MAAVKATSLTRIRYLEHHIGQLEDIAAEHWENPSAVASAVAARKASAEAHAELLRLRVLARKSSAPRSTAAQQRELDTERRRLRLGATAAESYVAAGKLLTEEQAALDRRVAEERAKRERLRAERELPEVVRELVDKLRALPEDVRGQIAAALVAVH